jgi:hypothetical protein
MNHWLANSEKNLLPLSKALDFKQALSEWFFTGEVDDYEGEEADIACELCEHPDLVHHFHIKNAHTSHSLLVGSSCILKFQQIEVRDERGLAILDPALRKRRLDAALREKVIDTSLGPVRKLWKAAPKKRNEIEYLAGEIKRDLGLTPRQLADLLTYLEEQGIPYSARLYKVNLRGSIATSEVTYMSKREFLQILPAMSNAQAVRARKLRGEV